MILGVHKDPAPLLNVLTVPPAAEFSLQPLDDVLQTLVLLFLLLVLFLPLLRRQLQVHRHRVLDGLSSEHTNSRVSVEHGDSLTHV